ncbi:MAG TPA: galactokinase [Actinomycetota bacterium]|nr:galactokinase [Actinomycetota bacterium]
MDPGDYSPRGEARVPPELRAAAPAGIAARAPGRANLIGEHTDYNEGFVLPVALELATFALGRRGGADIRLRSLQEPGEVVVDASTGRGPDEGWGRYARAVVRALLEAGVEVKGFHGAVHSEVPAGSGLSSSAALEVAVALAVSADPPGPVALAELCRRAENLYVGVETGIMDQLASAGGRAGHALLIDCRTNSVERVPVPDGVAVVVIDSTVRRGLDDSAYNERRAQCGEAARVLGVASLRDATARDLGRLGRDDDVLFRRARHVVTENERVRAVVDALGAGRLDAIGELFRASHTSLAEDYEVSVPELDELARAAWATPGVIGARLTGAGFGGCTVNLVDARAAEDVAAEIAERYERATSLRARWWVSTAADGAWVAPVP